MENPGFLKLTDADTNESILTLFGSGGVIKVVSFGDGTTELYNAEGNMIAKVKENTDKISTQLTR